jgi:hypothetical protein
MGKSDVEGYLNFFLSVWGGGGGPDASAPCWRPCEHEILGSCGGEHEAFWEVTLYRHILQLFE